MAFPQYSTRTGEARVAPLRTTMDPAEQGTDMAVMLRARRRPAAPSAAGSVTTPSHTDVDPAGTGRATRGYYPVRVIGGSSQAPSHVPTVNKRLHTCQWHTNCKPCPLPLQHLPGYAVATNATGLLTASTDVQAIKVVKVPVMPVAVMLPLLRRRTRTRFPELTTLTVLAPQYVEVTPDPAHTSCKGHT